MAIDTSGRWWRGESREDIQEYLEALSAESYPIKHFRESHCSCGSVEFLLERDSTSQARRKCPNCDSMHYIADAEESWEKGRVKKWKCVECKSDRSNVAVGFAGYDDDPTGIKWVFVGCRCAKCGVLGCFAEWKVGYGDALDLLEKA